MAEESTLMAGAAEVEITPPLEVGILMSSVQRRWEPFERVRLPLMARAVVIQCAGRRIALVSVDLLGISLKAFGRTFCRRVAAAAGDVVAPADIIVAATHTHAGPESIALSDLYRTQPFKDWAEQLVIHIGSAIRRASDSLRPCTLLAGSTRAPGLGIHRRIKTTQGILLSHPPPPPEIVISRDGPVDDSVNILALRNESASLVALLVNATCHPVHEMCIREISPDYPGRMSVELQRRHPGCIAMFFNGAAGNINPPTVLGRAGGC